jgi:hypothetical protein
MRVKTGIVEIASFASIFPIFIEIFLKIYEK